MLILTPLLVGEGPTSAGTSALVIGNKTFSKNHKKKSLSVLVDIKLGHLENSVSCLEAQLDSLGKVVQENRRELLDLLFLRQGGLCMALVESCSFYPSQSGI